MHGGVVKAESAGPGTGSTFTVTLPLVPAQTALADRTETASALSVEPGGRRLRVLVVDDNADGATMLSMLIGMHGHETELAHNGHDALAKLADWNPQVVFLDIGLPGLNGYEVARRVRAQEEACGGARTILVALTGWGSDDDKRRSREAGFDLHLTKPADANEVEAIVARICAELSG